MEKEIVREVLYGLDLDRRKFLRPRFLQLGLTVGEGQPRILKTLLEKGAMTQTELAKLCGLDVTTMSRTLDKLEKACLLKRQANPACRRSYLICLTGDGKEKAKAAQKIFRELDEEIWKDIPEEEMRRTRDTLEKIRENLRQGEKKTDRSSGCV